MSSSPSGPPSNARATSRGDAQDIPLLRSVDDLVVEPHPAGAGDHHVGLLLLAVAMAERRADARPVAELADAEVL